MSDDQEGRPARLAVAAAFVVCWVGVGLRVGVFGGHNAVAPFFDDFYYYVEIADRLLATGRSTFDGATLTNGYHPLWFVLILALRALVPAGAFHLATWAVLGLVTASGFAPLARVLRRCGLGPHAATAGAGASVLLALFEARTGMESFLVLALLPRVIEEVLHASPRWIRLGLLVSLTVLARLDAVVPLLAVGAWTLARHRAALGVGPLARLALGLAPVALYVASNLLVFGNLVPDSGAAKSLALWPGPYPDAFDFLRPSRSGLDDGMRFAVMLASPLAVLPVWRRLAPDGRALVGVLAAATALHYGGLALRSPWPTWTWYHYPAQLQACLVLALLTGLLPARLRPAVPWLVALPFAAVVGVAYPLRAAGRTSPFVQLATDVQGFAATHPGRYAMGDRAGAVAFLLDDPVVQLEGLVSGPGMLADLLAQRPLCEVLAAHDIDYYAFLGDAPDADCIPVREPHVGWSAAIPRMRGRLCGPVAHRLDNQGHVLRIYALRDPEVRCLPP
ncbi:MAG: hypothetical protein H6732_07695 [Alphaproteobacteria bacterium]|nr:hypothetical protein [Alphaproteobacteria bacterium]